MFTVYTTDLTVGDLSGHMTTIRASPLVSVVMEIEDPPTTVDLMDDRKCCCCLYFSYSVSMSLHVSIMKPYTLWTFLDLVSFIH